MTRKKESMPVKPTQVNEPTAVYANKVTITTFEELSEMDRDTMRNMTHEQRMEYLHKLITITHGTDLSEQEKKFYNGRIRINKTNENP